MQSHTLDQCLHRNLVTLHQSNKSRWSAAASVGKFRFVILLTFYFQFLNCFSLVTKRQKELLRLDWLKMFFFFSEDGVVYKFYALEKKLRDVPMLHGYHTHTHTQLILMLVTFLQASSIHLPCSRLAVEQIARHITIATPHTSQSRQICRHHDALLHSISITSTITLSPWAKNNAWVWRRLQKSMFDKEAIM